MNKGYICLVQNNKDTDYLRLAYILALSIKTTQSKINNISIVTDCKVPDHYKSVFDKVIKLKNDRAKDSDWKLHNIVDLYDYTPYDETVVLDSDMLFLNDISHWWDKLCERDLWFTSQVKNYHGQLITQDNPYRKEFVSNNLPNIYMAFFYFKKSQQAQQLFEQAQFVCENWDICVDKFLFRTRPKIFSTDVAFSLAIKMLGLEQQAINPFCSFPYFTHMKTLNQNWILNNYEISEDWSTYTPISFDMFDNKLNVKIGTTRQTDLLHYHTKDFVDDQQLSILEGLYNER